MKPGKIVQILLGLAIVGAGLYVFLKGADPAQLLRELKSTRPDMILASIGLGFLTLYLRAIRWRIMLPQSGGGSKKRLFDYTVIAFMINNILPLRLGEPARAFLLWQRNGFSASVSVGSLVLERLIDVLTYAAFFAAPVMVLPALSQFKPLAWLMTAAICAAALTFALYAFFTDWFAGIGGKALGLAPRRFRDTIAGIGRELASTLQWVKSPARATAVLALSPIIGACYAFILILFYGDIQQLGVLESLFAQSSAVIGSAIPLAPGYVGTLHATLLKGLSALSITGDRARALAITYYAVNYIPVTLAGILFYFKLNISFKDIRRAKERLKTRRPAASEKNGSSQTVS